MLLLLRESHACMYFSILSMGMTHQVLGRVTHEEKCVAIPHLVDFHAPWGR